MKAKPELSTILYTCISILFLLIFIPVLFCVLFLGNTMDYYENVKLITLFGNKRIAIFSILVILGLFLLFALLKKGKLTKKLSMFTNLGLGAAFVLLYFANVEVCKCIWFKQGWDVECVVGSAHDFYFICDLRAGTQAALLSLYAGFPLATGDLWVGVGDRLCDLYYRKEADAESGIIFMKK